MVEVTASLGSNVEPRVHLSAAVGHLKALFPGLEMSPVYESPAIGFRGANFLNLIVAFDTPSRLSQIQAAMSRIEDSRGRARNGAKHADRTLDIDILTYGAMVGQAAGISLPRDDILQYAFVLKPLADLRPEVHHPALGISYADLWRAFPNKHRQPLRLSPEI